MKGTLTEGRLAICLQLDAETLAEASSFVSAGLNYQRGEVEVFCSITEATLILEITIPKRTDATQYVIHMK